MANFKFWYSDPLGGDGDMIADDFNLSDALDVLFY